MANPRADSPLDDWPLSCEALPPGPVAPYDGELLDWKALWSRPEIDETAWVAPGAHVTGRVRLKRYSSVWYTCVLRGDSEFIEVGEETNVQDGAILHADPGAPCVLGNRVTLGHRALVHAAVVGEGALIAIGATVLTGARIGRGSLIAAGAVVTEGVEVPEHTMWAGCPARQVRELSDEHRTRLTHTWRDYVNHGAAYLSRYGREHIDALMSK